MAIQVNVDDGVITIALEENFDYRSRESFQRAFKKKPKKSQYFIDFDKVSFVDSSALGLLLILREYNGCNGSAIHLINTNKETRKMLEMVKFTTLFQLDKPTQQTPNKLDQEKENLKETFQDLFKRRKHL